MDAADTSVQAGAGASARAPASGYPLVSVLISNWNYAAYLVEAVESALGQSYEPLEVILVDDGSTDESPAVAATYSRRATVVRWPRSRGHQAAINEGFARCKGDIVLLLDSDDVFVPTKAAEVVRLFQRHPDAGACFHGRDLLTATGAAPGPELELSGRYDLRDAFRAGSAPFISTTTSGMCYRRSVLAALLPAPELAADGLSDHYLKWATLAVTPVIFDRRPLTLQRLHDRNHYTRPLHWRESSDKQSVIALLLRRRIPEARAFSRTLIVEASAELWRHGELPSRSSRVRAYFDEVGSLERAWLLLRGARLCCRRVLRRRLARSQRNARAPLIAR